MNQPKVVVLDTVQPRNKRKYVSQILVASAHFLNEDSNLN